MKLGLNKLETKEFEHKISLGSVINMNGNEVILTMSIIELVMQVRWMIFVTCGIVLEVACTDIGEWIGEDNSTDIISVVGKLDEI